METLLLLLACVTVCACFIESDLYVRSFGYSLVSIISQPKARSVVGCSQLCEKATGCNAFNFSKTDGACSLAGTFSSTNASNTAVYIRKTELPVTVY